MLKNDFMRQKESCLRFKTRSKWRIEEKMKGKTMWVNINEY